MKKFLQSDRYILAIWMFLPILNWATDFFKGRYNNFKIFKAMFWHLVEQKDIYATYPKEHYDLFFYGPAFSLLIAPFSIFPDIIAMPLWGLFNVWILYYALNQLKLKPELKIWIMVLSAIELGNSVWAQQFNPCVTALVALSFTSVENEKDFQAPFWIMLGTFTKIYGVVGFVFFLFSKHKGRYIAGSFVWAALFLVLPMLISSPQYILDTYVEWFQKLVAKNSFLIANISSDQSIMGLIRRNFGLEVPNLLVLIPGMLLLLLPLLRLKQYASKHFRTLILASILMFLVLFSTAAEHPTYIICIVGLFLWMVLQPKIFTVRNNILIFFVLVLTGLGPTYIFSKAAAEWLMLHSLKALPCTIAWGFLVWDLFTIDFQKEHNDERFVLQPSIATKATVSQIHPS